MKLEIPSIKDFDLIKSKKIESDNDINHCLVESLENKISYHLSTGSFELNKNKITFNIGGNYSKSVVDIVRKTMLEKGWKKFIVEKDTKTILFFSNVIIEK